MEAWREELYHYAKGETAKNHKYIRKEGNRYIYAEDNKSSTKNKSGIGNWLSGAANSVGNWVSGAANSIGNWASNAAKDVANTLDPKVAEAKAQLDKVKAEYAKFRGETGKNEFWKNRETMYNEAVQQIIDMGANESEAAAIVQTTIAGKHEEVDKFIANRSWYKEWVSAHLYNGPVMDDVLKPIIDDDYMAQWLRKDNEYKEKIKKWEEEYESLKHMDLCSPYISHGCLGGTAIIHRF